MNLKANGLLRKSFPIQLTKIFILFFCLVLLHTSCMEFQNTGTLTINLGDTATKSIMPSSVQVEWIQISGSRNDDSSITFPSQDFQVGGPIAITGLSVGTWTFSVVGYGQAPSQEGALPLTSVASDENVVIQSGKTTNASFALHYVDSGMGGFSLTVDWPETLPSFTKVEAVVGTLQVGGTIDGSSAHIEGNVAVGDYPVDVVFTNPLGSQISFPYMEMVNVYHGLDSSGSISFEAADFMQVQTPTISTSNTTGGQQVTIGSGTNEAAIHYTTDGSAPETSGTTARYEAPFTLTGTKTVRAIAAREGYLNSAEGGQEVVVSQVEAPVISTTAVAGGQQVSISSGTSGATIHYTTDGSAPTASSPTYGSSFKLTATKTVKAIAMKTGMVNSSVASQSVTVSRVATPTISPAGGLFSVSQQVTMSCATSSAAIHYTTDGSAPTASSPIYNGAITLNSTTTVKALAVKSGMLDSLSSSQSYTLMATVATPVITNTAVAGGQQVSISSGTSGATIYYTLDGSIPTTSSWIYGSPFKLNATNTVRAIATKTGMTNSAAATKSITVSTVTTPTISATAVAGGQQVSISSGTSGATIHYTTDGSAPTASSPTYGSSFKLTATKTVKAIAMKTGMVNSSVASQSITVSTVTTPTISTTAVTGGQQVSISSGTSGATIYYTTDGSTPTASSPTYGSSFMLTATKTVKAIAMKTGMVNSSVASQSVTVSRVATPTISPAGGLFSVSQQVTMSCATSSAAIHYTTDGSAPTASSPIYNGAITLNSTTTVKALAVKSGMLDSLSSSQSYTLMATVATPVITNTAVVGGQQVSISSGTSGATIHYTTDGSTPTASSPTYGSSFKLTTTTTVKAIAMKTDMTNSSVASKSITVSTVTTPTISATAVAGGQQVSISSGTSGATIHYTTDGTTPTTSSPVYSSSFKLTSTKTVKAFAVKTGMLDSSVASQSITVSTVTAPTISATAVAGGQQVSISSGTSGATIHYTTDGTTPTTSSPVYSSSFKLTSTKTVKAFAMKIGMTNSSVASKSITVSTVTTPTISATAVAGGQQVSISSGTSGATIHYTTDGSAPTASSPTYGSSFKLTATKTVKAIAMKTGMVNSAATTQSITVSTVTTPTISATAVAGGQQVSISSGTSGATIHYTTDGTTPTTSSPVYSSSFKLTATKTVKAIAMKTGMVNSSVASQSITVSTVTTPTISTTAVTGGQQVSISSGTSGAAIHYTTDGSAPTASSPTYGSSFKLTATKTVRAIATKTGMTNSAAASKSVTVSRVATPVISPSTTTFSGTLSVTLSSTSGATIYYTIDGSAPTASSPIYNGAITLNSTTTVKALAVKIGMSNSSTATKVYTLQQPAYAIGDTGPAGGTVFYVKPAATDGWQYLEAAPANEATLYSYGGFLSTIGSTKTAIGTGVYNTERIVDTLGAGNYAAKVCADKVLAGYDDWFLPSKDELNKMYENRATIGGFTASSSPKILNGDKVVYMSSSEYDSEHAWAQVFAGGMTFYSDGDQLSLSKNDFNLARVRAIRAF